MARILLDTYYVFMLVAKPASLSESERNLLSDPGNAIYVSAVSIWELRLKSAAIRRRREGAFNMPFSVIQAIQILRLQRVNFVHLSILHAAKKLEEDIGHRDPFDELLLVQAQEEGLSLLTADTELVEHPLAMCP